MLTPWGKSDYQAWVRDGVYVVSTPGHGGVLVGKSVARDELSAEARAVGEDFGSWLAFEEDCAWSAVARERPWWFVGTYSGTAEEIKASAEECFDRWYGEGRTKWEREDHGKGYHARGKSARCPVCQGKE